MTRSIYPNNIAITVTLNMATIYIYIITCVIYLDNPTITCV